VIQPYTAALAARLTNRRHPEFFQEDLEIKPAEGFTVCAPSRRGWRGGGRYAHFCYKIKPTVPKHGNACAECRKLTSKLHYEANKEKYKKRADAWRESHPEAARQHHITSAANARAKGKVRKRSLEQNRASYARGRDKIVARRRERALLERMRAGAPIPMAVFLPHLERLRCQLVAMHDLDINTGENRAGINELGVIGGIVGRRVNDYFAGETRTVSLETADRFVMRMDWTTLTEIQKEAEAWAAETGDPWPRTYISPERVRPASAKISRTRMRAMWRVITVDLGREPSLYEWVRHPLACSDTPIFREYGSWRTFTKMMRGWTPDEIVVAVHLWVDQQGVVPCVSDWRAPGRDNPNFEEVKRVFGSWSAGIEAAGLHCRAA
jgi:hypothetical protein